LFPLPGDILAKDVNGNITLVGAEGTTAQECYGILLDFSVVPGGPIPSCSVARSGVYDACQLRTTGGVSI
jgi:hypothetical protein